MTEENTGSTQNDVDLDTWLEDAVERLKAFAAMWRIENKKDPEVYPLTMPMGEWDEQYHCSEGG